MTQSATDRHELSSDNVRQQPPFEELNVRDPSLKGFNGFMVLAYPYFWVDDDDENYRIRSKQGISLAADTLPHVSAKRH
jgi:hypothetical protein